MIVRYLSIIITALLLWMNTASAQEYYVDYASGSDSDLGTSSGTAWQHCPGDDNATGNAGSAILTAGDIIYFRGKNRVAS